MIRTLFAILAACALGTGVATADPPSVYTWHFALVERKAAPGDLVHVKATAVINDGWHIYSTKSYGEDGPLPTTFHVKPAALFALDGAVKQPPPKTKQDESFQIVAEYYEKSATFTLPVRVSAQAAPGTQTLMVEVNAMACNDRMCMPPRTETASLPLTIVAGSSAIASPAAAPTASAPSDSSTRHVASASPGSPTAPPLGAASGIERDKSRGLAWFIGFAFTMGFLALLTPCVFPMVPLTVSFFAKRDAGSHRRGLTDAALYGLGIVLTFTALGFLFALAFGATSLANLATSPAVNLLFALLFLALALNLFGVYEFRVPTGLVNRLNLSVGGGERRSGILVMGLTFTITSFTCTVPFVGTVMVAAAHGEYLWPLAGMLAFSTAFALPFVLLALFPHALKRLPRSGDWMHGVQVVMGFLELAAVIKFLSNADLVWQWHMLTRDVFLSTWIAIAVVLAVYLLGLVRFHHEQGDARVGIARLLLAIVFLSTAFFFYSGINGAPLGTIDAYLPPADYGSVARPDVATRTAGVLPASPGGHGGAATDSRAWLADYRAGLERAAREHKNVFIDFTGFTCTNCRWMEANIFTRPAIDSMLDRFVLVRLYTDGDGPQYAANQRFEEQQFGTIALPFYVIVTPDGETIATFAKGMTRDVDEFRSFLQTGLAPLLAAR